MVEGFVIRQALASEQHDLEELERRAGLANPGDRAAILSHREIIEVPPDQILAGDVFVLETAGVIAGFASLKRRSDRETDLDGLFVEPEMQRHGFGRLLVEHCAEVARTRGSLYLFVIGNPHAEAFYAACRFQFLGPCETRFGPALLMRKAL